LLAADEAYLTNSLMEIMPLARVENWDIGCGQSFTAFLSFCLFLSL